MVAGKKGYSGKWSSPPFLSQILAEVSAIIDPEGEPLFSAFSSPEPYQVNLVCDIWSATSPGAQLSLRPPNQFFLILLVLTMQPRRLSTLKVSKAIKLLRRDIWKHRQF